VVCRALESALPIVEAARLLREANAKRDAVIQDTKIPYLEFEHILDDYHEAISELVAAVVATKGDRE
jgi:hypothetical protein